MRADGGVCRRESTITRSGWRAVATSRTSSRGSSSSTVPTPVSRAPARLRQAWPSVRAASPVIHWLTPLSSALRPSSETAALSRSQGRPRSMRETKPMLSSRASSSHRPDDDLDAGGGETRGTLAGDERIRIAHRHHHPADAGGDERIGAGWRAAVVRAGLEADDDGGAAYIDTAARGVAQRHHLGVRAARLLGVAAADDAAAAIDDDAADARIGIGEAHRLLGERERLAHGFGEGVRIGGGRRRVVQGVRRAGSGLMWQRAEAGAKARPLRSRPGRPGRRARPGNSAPGASRRRRHSPEDARCSHRSRRSRRRPRPPRCA